VKDGQDRGGAIAASYPVKEDDHLDEVRGTAGQDDPDSARLLIIHLAIL
jgi:hypothetical protein